MANSSSQITLTWTASTDDVGVTGYRIDHCTSPVGCTPTTQLVVDPASPFAHTGLAPNSLHRYRISARDAAGNPSAPRGSSLPRPPPRTRQMSWPPRCLGSPAALANTSSQITLTWTDSTDAVGVTGYRIDHCTTAACHATTQLVVDAGSPFVHTGLTPETPASL